MTVLASDDFNRADNADLGTNWDAGVGETDVFKILTNAAAFTSNFDVDETWNVLTPPNDQYATSTLKATAADGVGIGFGVTVRRSVAARTYYRLVGNASGYELGRRNAGTFTSMASGSGTTFAAADKITLEYFGSTPTLKKNGVAFGSPPTDSSIASGRFGVCYSSTAAANDAIDAWEGGDFSGGAPLLRPRIFKVPRLLLRNVLPPADAIIIAAPAVVLPQPGAQKTLLFKLPNLLRGIFLPAADAIIIPSPDVILPQPGAMQPLLFQLFRGRRALPRGTPPIWLPPPPIEPRLVQPMVMLLRMMPRVLRLNTITPPAVYLRIFGITKDSSGVPLGNCVVHLFRTSDDLEMDQGVSDGVGNYEFRGVSPAATYYVVAYKVGSPDVAGTTVNTLIGT